MTRDSQTVTLNLSPELVDQLERVRSEHGWSLEELVQAALARYVDEHEWEGLLEYGSQRAKDQDLSPDDVERLIDEYRAEAESYTG